MFNRSSSALSSGSLKISHHFPLRAASCGCAACHVPGGAALYAAGDASLKAGGVGVTGAAYLGPTLHPLSREIQIAAAQAALPALLRFSVGLGGFSVIDPIHLNRGAGGRTGPMAKHVVLLSQHPQPQPIECQVEHRRRIEREQLTQD